MIVKGKSGSFILIVFACSFLILGSILLAISIQRVNLPYNSEGRYFDPETTVVYHRHAVVVFLVLSTFSYLISILTFMGAAIGSRKSAKIARSRNQ